MSHNMLQVLCLVLLYGQTLSASKKETDLNEDKAALASSKNARYYFSAAIDDAKNDVKSYRKELRVGVDVVGSFAYSDGFVQREVLYAADQNGYRIISDKMEYIPHPPKENIENSSQTRELNSAPLVKSSSSSLYHSNKTKF